MASALFTAPPVGRCFFVTDGNTETANDGSHTPYHERGWPTFEYHVSAIGKAPHAP